MKSLHALVLVAAAACASTPGPREAPLFAHSTVAADYDTYELRRVGVMPAAGGSLDSPMSGALVAGLVSEISRSTPLEVVRLDRRDLAEVDESEPYRRGKYELATIIDLARRYRLDAILFPTIHQQQYFEPIQLGVQADLVSSETGLVIWTGNVHLDGSDPVVQHGMSTFYGREEAGDELARGWEIALVSPSRYARFAAYQIARLL